MMKEQKLIQTNNIKIKNMKRDFTKKTEIEGVVLTVEGIKTLMKFQKDESHILNGHIENLNYAICWITSILDTLPEDEYETAVDIMQVISYANRDLHGLLIQQ